MGRGQEPGSPAEDSPRPTAMPKGRVIPVRSKDGIRLHTEVFGPEDGYPIVLAHGITCAHPGVGLPDRRPGHRLPRHRLRPPRPRQSARAGATGPLQPRLPGRRSRRGARRDAAPGERAVIAGHSMGGIAITSWAERHPERVPQRADAVALINTTTGDLLRNVQFAAGARTAGRRAGARGGNTAQDLRRRAAAARGGPAEPAVRLDDRGGPRRRPGGRRVRLRAVHLDAGRRPRRLGPHTGRRARSRAHRADTTSRCRRWSSAARKTACCRWCRRAASPGWRRTSPRSLSWPAGTARSSSARTRSTAICGC